jgi:transposase-like protein
MEFQVNAAGKRIFPPEFKKRVLEELSQGATVPELARKYDIQVNNIFHWRKSQQLAAFTGRPSVSQTQSAQILQEMVPLEEYRRLMEENKNLRRSLANMTMDRDILKEAVDIAAKKKWI